MPLPALDCGTVLFVPRQGLFRVAAVRQQVINEQRYAICDMHHVFTGKPCSQAQSGLERTNAREPTSAQIAFERAKLLREPPRRSINGPWHKQKATLEDRLKIGTLEKNVEVLRMLHRIDQDRWKTARVEFYQHVLDLVAEELAFVLKEPLETSRRTIVQTLNNMVLEHL